MREKGRESKGDKRVGRTPLCTHAFLATYRRASGGRSSSESDTGRPSTPRMMNQYVPCESHEAACVSVTRMDEPKGMRTVDHTLQRPG